MRYVLIQVPKNCTTGFWPVAHIEAFTDWDLACFANQLVNRVTHDAYFIPEKQFREKEPHAAP